MKACEQYAPLVTEKSVQDITEIIKNNVLTKKNKKHFQYFHFKQIKAKENRHVFPLKETLGENVIS